MNAEENLILRCSGSVRIEEFRHGSALRARGRNSESRSVDDSVHCADRIRERTRGTLPEFVNPMRCMTGVLLIDDPQMYRDPVPPFPAK